VNDFTPILKSRGKKSVHDLMLLGLLDSWLQYQQIAFYLRMPSHTAKAGLDELISQGSKQSQELAASEVPHLINFSLVN
jgi:hypothetical protein